jgi:hypothetical protein
MAQIIALHRAYDEVRARVWNMEKFRDPVFEDPAFWAACIALGDAAKRMRAAEGTGHSQ